MTTSERIKDILEWILCIVIAVVLALLVKYYIGTPTEVKSISMNPTLIEGQRLILNRIPRTSKKMPSRGEIITFEAPTQNNISLKTNYQENPSAIYDDEDRNFFANFVYHVLEVTKTSYIKRVIALPGEHVEIKDGKVFINGEKLDEPYLQDGVTTESSVLKDFIVPEGHIFAMGDNREHSSDCRAFGCIPLEKIEGKVLIRIWPLNKFGTV